MQACVDLGAVKTRSKASKSPPPPPQAYIYHGPIRKSKPRLLPRRGEPAVAACVRFSLLASHLRLACRTLR